MLIQNLRGWVDVGWVGLMLGLGLDRKSKTEYLFLIIEKIIFECFFVIFFSIFKAEEP